MPAIIGPLPARLLAGQPVSASPVMADFDWIVAQVNANAVPLAAGTTAIAVHATAVTTFLTSNVAYVLGSTNSTVDYDVLNEWLSGVFTCISPGIYQLSVIADFGTSGTTFTTSQPYITVTGTGATVTQKALTPGNFPASNNNGVSASYSFRMLAGQTLQAEAQAGFSAGIVALVYSLTIARVG